MVFAPSARGIRVFRALSITSFRNSQYVNSHSGSLTIRTILLSPKASGSSGVLVAHTISFVSTLCCGSSCLTDGASGALGHSSSPVTPHSCWVACSLDASTRPNNLSHIKEISPFVFFQTISQSALKISKVSRKISLTISLSINLKPYKYDYSKCNNVPQRADNAEL